MPICPFLLSLWRFYFQSLFIQPIFVYVSRAILSPLDEEAADVFIQAGVGRVPERSVGAGGRRAQTARIADKDDAAAAGDAAADVEPVDDRQIDVAIGRINPHCIDVLAGEPDVGTSK